MGPFILLYAALYSAFGAASPLWPLFFETRGLNSQEIGTLLGLGILARLVSGPVIGRFADVSGFLRLTLAVCTALAAGLSLALVGATPFWLLLTIHVVQAAVLAPLTGTADALAVNAARKFGFEYGWVRGIGSAAFILGTLAMGQVLRDSGITVILWMNACCLVLAIIAAAFVPPLQYDGQPSRTPSYFGGIRELWDTLIFRWLILVAGLIYGSHAVHDAFSVIRWNGAGVPPEIVSILWSEAVAAEIIVFFWIGPTLVRVLGPRGAAIVAAAAGLLRWVIASQTTSAAILAVIQPLHGLTFALLHLACMRLIGSTVPVRLAATAQALYAFAAGLATMIFTIVSGTLYADYGGNAFLAMGFLCGLAIPLAWIGLRTFER